MGQMRNAVLTKKNIVNKAPNEYYTAVGTIPTKQHPTKVLDIINHFLFNTENGYLIITLQDGYVIKLDKMEKYLITAHNRDDEYTKCAKPQGVHPLQVKVVTELQDIQYGQLVIRVNHGKLEQIEKTEKRRVTEVEGAYGDGI